ncbi:MAG: hypothetical protein QOE26_2737 [Verrucomicrobiota bacterium]|jgi:hypothetical protein
MFAKIFTQIYDSSIVENAELRFTFMDLLVLADCNGVVDMTHEAISRRTNRPIELIRQTITELEQPDAKSRTPQFRGARIKRLDAHRDWGWMILNYDRFRKTASEEQRREKTKARTHKWRERTANSDAIVTHGDASDARQRQKQKEKQTQKNKEEMPLFPSTGVANELPAILNTPSFVSAWEDWKSHRREIKKPLTTTSIKGQLAELASWGEQRAINAIRYTIRKGWQGLREDDSRNGSTPDRREKINVPITRR